MYKFSLHTSDRTGMYDITSKIQELVSKSNVTSGICLVYIPHTTAGVTINENGDPDVVRDILKEINDVIPFEDNYRHFEGNSAAHIKTSLFGVSQNIIIENGRLVLGTWQSIYFCEFDGPRNRNVFVKIL